MRKFQMFELMLFRIIVAYTVVIAGVSGSWRQYVILCPYPTHRQYNSCSMLMENGDSYPLLNSSKAVSYKTVNGNQISGTVPSIFTPYDMNCSFIIAVVTVMGLSQHKPKITRVQHKLQNGNIVLYKPIETEKKAMSYKLINMCQRKRLCHCIVVSQPETKGSLHFNITLPADSDVIYRTTNKTEHLNQMISYVPKQKFNFLLLEANRSGLYDVTIVGGGNGTVAIFCGNLNDEPYLLTQVPPLSCFTMEQSTESKFDISNSSIRSSLFIMNVDKETAAKIKFSTSTKSVSFQKHKVRTILLDVKKDFNCIQSPGGVHVALAISNNCTRTNQSTLNNSVCREMFFKHAQSNTDGSYHFVAATEYAKCGSQSFTQTIDSTLTQTNLAYLAIQTSSSASLNIAHIYPAQCGASSTIPTITSNQHDSKLTSDVYLRTALEPFEITQTMITQQNTVTDSTNSRASSRASHLHLSSSKHSEPFGIAASETYSSSITQNLARVSIVTAHIQTSLGISISPSNTIAVGYTYTSQLDAVHTEATMDLHPIPITESSEWVTQSQHMYHQVMTTDSLHTEIPDSASAALQSSVYLSVATSGSYLTTESIEPNNVLSTTITSDSEVCSCSCLDSEMNSALLDPTSNVFKKELRELKESLKVDKSKLSSTLNKLNSAYDKRTSSATIGYLGLIIIFGVICIIVFLDIGTLFVSLKKRCFKPSMQHMERGGRHRRGSQLKLISGKVKRRTRRVSSIEEYESDMC